MVNNYALKIWRVMKGLRQRDLAQKLGVQQGTISMAERGIHSKRFAEKFKKAFPGQQRLIKELKTNQARES